MKYLPINRCLKKLKSRPLGTSDTSGTLVTTSDTKGCERCEIGTCSAKTTILNKVKMPQAIRNPQIKSTKVSYCFLAIKNF